MSGDHLCLIFLLRTVLSSELNQVAQGLVQRLLGWKFHKFFGALQCIFLPSLERVETFSIAVCDFCFLSFYCASLAGSHFHETFCEVVEVCNQTPVLEYVKPTPLTCPCFSISQPLTILETHGDSSPFFYFFLGANGSRKDAFFHTQTL